MKCELPKKDKTLIKASLLSAMCWLAAASGAVAQAADAPRLMRNPSLSISQVAFLFADEIWTAPRAGGVARAVTDGARALGGPFFSPDGNWIAYSAASGGNSDFFSGPASDIFIVSAMGGEPRRLTWHPDGESLVSWSPDGRDVIFASNRASGLRGAPKLFRTAADGTGAPTAFPLPTGTDMSFSPDTKRVAYTPVGTRGWKGYRGGRASYIWLVDLATLDLVEVPHTKASDWDPMWIGGKVFFLSDRDGPVTLYAFDIASGKVRRAIDNKGFDFMSASAGPDGIVIDAFDSIKIFDPASERISSVAIHIDDKFEALARRTVDLPGERAVKTALSPTGDRNAIEARGEIFIAPTDGGPARNVTNSVAVADRSPFWSPDGTQLAYVNDASGEYQLVIRPADGSGTPRVLPLGVGHGVFSNFRWAPDGRQIAYQDETTAIWILDVAKGKSVKVVKDPYGVGMESPSWSPDGRWLAYTYKGPNRMGLVFLYSTEAGTSAQVTDGRTDAFSPTFDQSGQYLYFLAGADRPMAEMSAMSATGRPSRAGLYAVLLSRGTLPPATQSEAAATAPAVNLEDLLSRIVGLSVPERNYRELVAGAPGVVYLAEAHGESSSSSGQTVWRMTWPDKKLDTFLTDVQGFELIASGATAVVRRDSKTDLIPVEEIRPGADGAPPVVPAGQRVGVPVLTVTADPKAEWEQIYKEAWRFQRDLFYAGHFNGLDLAKAEARYAPFVAGLASRTDLTYLIREMMTNLSVSHLGVRDPPRDDPAFGTPGAPAIELEAAGLLGADYVIENDRYRITRIYRGDVWMDNGVGPLAQPGVSVNESDYLIAVNGRELHAVDNLDQAFEGLAGNAVEIQVSNEATAANARTFEVTPVTNDFSLRHVAWIEDKRRMTDHLSGGKVAYVYVINTTNEGYTGFNRQYLAQVGKAGVVIDERNNGGGPIADYIVNQMLRTRLVQVWPRFGDMALTFPSDHINGPAAMLINESAGSGGDILPYMFQKAKAGPLVGKRTWGGSIGAGPTPSFLDGGTMNVPHFPISDPDGTWGGLEGSGAVPDIEVKIDPKSAKVGRDLQLEAAVTYVLDQLEGHPRPAPLPPPARTTHPVTQSRGPQ